MQTVIRGASQLTVTRSHMAPGSSAGTGGRWPGCWPTRPSRSPSSARTPHHLQESVGALDLALSRDDLAEIDSIMAAAVPLGGPSAEGMT
jgi:hypothetical protein